MISEVVYHEIYFCNAAWFDFYYLSSSSGQVLDCELASHRRNENKEEEEGFSVLKLSRPGKRASLTLRKACSKAGRVFKNKAAMNDPGLLRGIEGKFKVVESKFHGLEVLGLDDNSITKRVSCFV